MKTIYIINGIARVNSIKTVTTGEITGILRYLTVPKIVPKIRLKTASKVKFASAKTFVNAAA